MKSSFRSWHERFFLRFSSRQQFIVASALTAALAGLSFAATAESTKADVDRLVAAAGQAEISGDISNSFALLHDAIRIDPENRLARWQLGQVKIDNQWTTVEEAQRRASSDPLQAEYREHRAMAAAGDVQGQLAIAKWCRKKNLNEEALFHWASVLAVDPKNDDALRARFALAKRPIADERASGRLQGTIARREASGRALGTEDR